MTKPQIISEITIKREIRKRVASFKALIEDPMSGEPRELLLSITGNTLQDVIGKIELQYGIKLTAKDYSYNYHLRKDEFVPETTPAFGHPSLEEKGGELLAVVKEAEELLQVCTEEIKKKEVCFTCGKPAYGKVKPKDSEVEYFYCLKHFKELVVTAPLQMEKTHRNAPCHCGSGKKYKFCCLLTEPKAVAGHYYDSEYEVMQEPIKEEV